MQFINTKIERHVEIKHGITLSKYMNDIGVLEDSSQGIGTGFMEDSQFAAVSSETFIPNRPKRQRNLHNYSDMVELNETDEINITWGKRNSRTYEEWQKSPKYLRATPTSDPEPTVPAVRVEKTRYTQYIPGLRTSGVTAPCLVGSNSSMKENRLETDKPALISGQESNSIHYNVDNVNQMDSENQLSPNRSADILNTLQREGNETNGDKPGLERTVVFLSGEFVYLCPFLLSGCQAVTDLKVRNIDLIFYNIYEYINIISDSNI